MDIQTNVFKKTLRRHTGVSPEILHFSITGKIGVGRDRRYFSNNQIIYYYVCNAQRQHRAHHRRIHLRNAQQPQNL